MLERTYIDKTIICGLALMSATWLMPSAQAAAQDSNPADIKQAVKQFASKNQFQGVTLNAAWRRLPATDFIRKHVKAFESYTGLKINFTEYPERQLRAKEAADASAKAGGYDLYVIGDFNLPLFEANGWVKPIGKSIKPSYDLNDTFRSTLNLYKWNNTLYGLPIYSEATILYYRKDLFKKNNLKPPRTISELRKDAKILNNPPRVYGIALRGLRGEGMNAYTWSSWLRSYGGKYFDKSMHPTFNSKQGVEAAKSYSQLINKYGPPGSSTWGWPKIISAFSSGRVAMIIDADAFYPTLTDPKQSNIANKIGYSVIPAGPAGRFPALFSLGLAIPSTTINPDKVKAAQAFIQWATSKQMQFDELEKAGIANVTRKSVFHSKQIKTRVSQQYLKADTASRAIQKVDIVPLIPQYREVGDELGKELENIFTGDKSAKTGLDDAAKSVASDLKSKGVLGTKRPYDESQVFSCSQVVSRYRALCNGSN